MEVLYDGDTPISWMVYSGQSYEWFRGRSISANLHICHFIRARANHPKIHHRVKIKNIKTWMVYCCFTNILYSYMCVCSMHAYIHLYIYIYAAVSRVGGPPPSGGGERPPQTTTTGQGRGGKGRKSRQPQREERPWPSPGGGCETLHHIYILRILYIIKITLKKIEYGIFNILVGMSWHFYIWSTSGLLYVPRTPDNS